MTGHWADTLEGMVHMELDEPPETNCQMATDILYSFDYDPGTIPKLVYELALSVVTAIDPFIMDFLNRMKALGAGCELSSVTIYPNQYAQIRFNVLDLTLIELWENTRLNTRSTLNELI